MTATTNTCNCSHFLSAVNSSGRSIRLQVILELSLHYSGQANSLSLYSWFTIQSYTDLQLTPLGFGLSDTTQTQDVCTAVEQSNSVPLLISYRY